MKSNRCFGVDDLARAPARLLPGGVYALSGAHFIATDDRRRSRFLFPLKLPGAGIAGMQGFRSWLIRTKPSFDRKSEYFDPKASRRQPALVHVDVTLVRKPACSGFRNYARIRSSRRCAYSSAATPVHYAGGFPAREFIMKLL